ncbi:translation initiation factor IF-2-like [Leopardus geoffroyi]|uniref:translation initiation factor IF-2-like n=1 Tax=Leopardus geoffroyi TaxID=46844 RepID=UPI001E263A1D|nr:translation initiation factor IF-2-like [Leopardus geoffroyi]
MMLRSPLPAAAASHTASHVSLPLFFFFLTSARGGAATARPLTSPLLARPRPGRGGGGGEGAAPARARPPGPTASRLRRGGATGRGGGRRGRACRSPRSQPRRRGTERARLARAPGWGRPWPRPAGARRWLAGSPLFPRAPPHYPWLKAARPRLRKQREVA